MRNQPGVLIVEDEPAIAELIAVNLRHNGFRPLWAMDSASAQRELDAVLPDVILLDWMLPGESGFSVVKFGSGFVDCQAFFHQGASGTNSRCTEAACPRARCQPGDGWGLVT